MMLLLEQRFAKHPYQTIQSSTSEPPYGIIILGGSVNPYLTAKRESLSLNETVERLSEGVALFRRFPSSKLIFTGGGPHIFNSNYQSEAMLTKSFFNQIGFDDAHVIYEDQSLNTYENAFLTAKILMPKPEQRFILITSAFHMPRSMAFFRKAGFNVEAYPVDYLTAGWVAAKRPHFTMSGGLNMAEVAMKEWIGLFVYWVTDKIPELYPSP